jgi:hypothetical protein
VFSSLAGREQEFFPLVLGLPDVLGVSPHLSEPFPVFLVAHVLMDFEEGIDAISPLMPPDVSMPLAVSQSLLAFLFLEAKLLIVDVVEVGDIHHLFDEGMLNLLPKGSRDKDQFGIQVNLREFV